MNLCHTLSRLVILMALSCELLAGSAARAEAPSAKLALSFKPVQKDVDYDTPDEKEFEKCQVQVERAGKASGWVVLSPTGQVLRRFVDTNGDNVVDQWRYYRVGLEVYRDVDSNFNNKVDQSRWMNSAGTRWGVDTNEDGRIDRWRILSAEESSREAVRALIARDEAAMSALLIDKGDLTALGIDAEISKKIQDAVSGVPAKIKAAAASTKILDGKAKWARFDVSHPNLIPAEDGKSAADLHLYENAMAIVENDGKTALVQIGELVKVGDVWKLTQVPVVLEGNNVQIAAGFLMQPAVVTPSGNPSSGTVTEKMQKLLERLQELDKKAPSTNDSAKAIARYNSERAELLAQVVAEAKGNDRDQWIRQMVDGIAAAVQTGNYDDGVQKLKAIEADVKKSESKPLVAYVSYRVMLASYTQELQSANNNKRQEVQDNWLKGLEDFARAYPEADDTAEALLQLAIAQEFNGKVADAKKWYDQLATKHAKTPQGIKAAGALRRLDLKGKSFTLAGGGLKGGKMSTRDLRGKVVLVLYWASWCKPCTEDLPLLKAAYQQYRDQGFEIVGVNLDMTTAPATAYIAEHKIAWPQMYEPGGLDSPLSIEYGVISLPTMILIDATGTCHTRSVAAGDLKTLLPDLLKAKK